MLSVGSGLCVLTAAMAAANKKSNEGYLRSEVRGLIARDLHAANDSFPRPRPCWIKK